MLNSKQQKIEQLIDANIKKEIKRGLQKGYKLNNEQIEDVYQESYLLFLKSIKGENNSRKCYDFVCENIDKDEKIKGKEFFSAISYLQSSINSKTTKAIWKVLGIKDPVYVKNKDRKEGENINIKYIYKIEEDKLGRKLTTEEKLKLDNKESNIKHVSLDEIIEKSDNIDFRKELNLIEFYREIQKYINLELLVENDDVKKNILNFIQNKKTNTRVLKGFFQRLAKFIANIDAQYNGIEEEYIPMIFEEICIVSKRRKIDSFFKSNIFKNFKEIVRN